MEDSVKAVIAADLYCHSACFQSYTKVHKFDTPDKPVISEFCTLSDISDFTISLLKGEEMTSIF